MKSLYDLLTKRGQTFSFGLGAIISILYYILVFKGMDSFEALGEDAQGTSDIFNFGLKTAMGLVVIAFIGLFLFAIANVAMDIKGSLKGLIGFAVIAVIFFALYSMADPTAIDADMAKTMVDFKVSGSVFKFVSAAIGTAVTMIVIALVALVGSASLNMFK